MHIDRTLSYVIMVIERIYLPRAQETGTFLSLRSEIATEIYFSPIFFINLIQITGNLVANAFKIIPSNGSVDVVYTLNDDEGRSKLNMTITYSGKSIPDDLVSVFSQGEKIEKPINADGEPCFATRLHHVMQIVSKENGRMFMKRENDSETTFFLAFPVPGKYLNQRTGFYPIVKTGEVFVNGS